MPRLARLESGAASAGSNRRLLLPGRPGRQCSALPGRSLLNPISANACGNRDARAAGAEHLSQQFLRQWQRVSSNAFGAHQQPPRQALLNIVEPVAGRYLRDLRGRDLCELLQLPLQFRALLQNCEQCLGVHPEHRRFDLNHRARGGVEKTSKSVASLQSLLCRPNRPPRWLHRGRR